MSIESKQKRATSQSRLDSVASQQEPVLSMGDIEAATFGDGQSDHQMEDDDKVDLNKDSIQPTFG